MTNPRRLLAVLLPLAVALFLIFLLFFIGSPPPASAAAFRVCPAGPPACTWSTIQAAATGAYDGAEILVAEGAYMENVVITRSVILRGGWKADFSVRDWDRYLTVINGRRLGTVVQVQGTAAPTLEGFVITNGDASGFLGWGGGIFVYQTVPVASGPTVIRHNVISDNIASSGPGQGYGGGVMVYSSRVLIDQNTILSNTARSAGEGGGHGGGLAAWGWGSVVTVTGNIVVSNTAMYSTTGLWSGEGGGIWVDNVSEVVLTGNEVSHNVAARKGAGYGGGMYVIGYLQGNRVISNTASLTGPGYGGGIYAAWVQSLDSNQVEQNTAAAAGDGTGGGIYANQMQSASGNTVAGNTATRGGGIYLGAGSHTTLRDSTITGNHATGAAGPTNNGGGGIASVDYDAVIDGNTIVNNTAVYLGGGLLATGGHYSISGNTLQQNTSSFGGGAFLYTSAGDVSRNLVLNNTANTRGGGIYVWSGVTATLDANQVLDNAAAGGQGGGLVVNNDTAPVTITNQMVARNSSGVAGGGVFVGAAPAVRLINNTIVDNDFGAAKQGLVLEATGTVAVTNNLLVGHSIGISVSAGSSAVLSHNDYWDNAAAVSGQAAGVTDMTLDPSFVNRASGNYHLAPASAVVDEGDGVVYAPFDFEGDPRPRGAGVDVGADEAYRTSSYVSDLTGDDGGGHDGSPGSPFRTVTKGISETQSGGTVYVGRGTYLECITVTRGVALLGGYRESDWTRNISSFLSTLNGAGLGTVVLIDGAGVVAKLEGFRVTGGNAKTIGGLGGGVLVMGGARATITNNRIDGNLAQNAGAGLLVSADNGAPSTISFNAIYNNRALGQFAPMSGVAALLPQQGPEVGGGVLLFGGPITMTNNLVYSNTSALGGDGLAILNGGAEPVRVYHNTLADNGGITSTAVYLSAEAPVYVMNNLIVGYGTAITGSGTAGVILADYNGFWANAHNYGPGLTPGAHDVTGDPLLASRAGRDYHIGLASPLAGAGADLGVLLDYDGNARPSPAGTAPDIGAYEVSQRRQYLPVVMRN